MSNHELMRLAKENAALRAEVERLKQRPSVEERKLWAKDQDQRIAENDALRVEVERMRGLVNAAGKENAALRDAVERMNGAIAERDVLIGRLERGEQS